jgi:peptidoglycan/LPS O-acetylase OafA/YrhL
MSATVVDTSIAQVIRPSPLAKVNGRISQLDGLRGVAIGLVILYHYFSLHLTVAAHTAAWFLVYPTRFGWSGVDLFFVLSGYLIGGILLDARNSSNYFGVFYLRRFFRIVPIYYLVLIVFFSLIGWFGRHPSHLWPWSLQENLPRFTYFLFLQNIWGAITNSLGSAPLAVYWSLSVEEQFYFTLPLLVRFLSRERLRALAVEIILLAPMLRIALFSFYPSHTHSWYLLMPCRADSLFFGVLAAVVLSDREWRNKIEGNRGILQMLILLLTAGVPFVAQTQWAFHGLIMVSLMFSWFAALYFLVLIYAVTFTASSLTSVLNWGWLRKLGIIAYGVYLLHEGILDFLRCAIATMPGFLRSCPYEVVALVSIGVTILMAQLSWQKFEKPLVDFSHRYKYNQPAAS